ncbi:PBP1A family penicillin-binding protein [Limosilactobacillus caecicola]|uniref:PBP1A family penicillin-binding protein n=1 Tax=Limosilactobacillus caecicola TaxID=2941332 RepID=UPI00203FC473|nr:PBP1A family penicillin-binding protein [Limosilactobacillus caecicola]
MKPTRQGNNEFKERLKAWVKDHWARLRAWCHPYWARFREWLRRFWHRYQLTRWIIVVVLALFLIMSTYLTIVAKTAGVSKLESRLQQNTIIYDHKNQQAGSLYSQKGTYVQLNKISSNVPNAVLSTEDRGFYHEHGFSIRGLGRAGLLLIKNKLLRRNYISGGGSTLTQQLVKNAFLTQQQTFSRKAKEIFISIEVENQYSKKQILTMYLNNAYFGHGVWGIQDAAKRYFNCNASELTVPQAATLAGMLTSPGIYDPVNHPQAAKQRRNVVLQLMVENKKLSQSAANQYKKTPLTVSNGYKYEDTYKYPYYFDAVISEAISRYHLSEKEVMNNGYKIYTTLDQGQQKAMQNVYDDDDNFPSSTGATVQSASIAMNPKTGGVTAIVGGRGTHVFRGYNRATQMSRQPGSTMKPIAVYTPALEHGYFYDSSLQDKKQSYGSNHYTPRNYNNQYSGTVPMYKAVYESLNAPAVWLLNKIGVNAGYSMAQKFGIPVTKSDKNLALALGGMTKGVSPAQMARAYSVFASGGSLPTTHFITKIEDSSGKVIKRDQKIKTKRIISKKVDNEMTSMLIGVFKHGTAKTARPSGYTLAGKTGTTDTGKDDNNDRDQWIIGYTPDVVVATWEGYDNAKKNQYLSSVESTDINSLFKTEMSSLLPNTSGTKFTVKDAQEKAQANTSSSSSWTDQLTEQVKQGANELGNKASQLWSGIRSMF